MPNSCLPPGWPADSDWTELLIATVILAEARPKDVFNAFRLTGFVDVKAVILGQDPYHGPNQAHGLSFSVGEDCRVPPSLKNIFKELQSDLDCSEPTHGNLDSWARQGVLLLNTVLTVRDGEANSHRTRGWESFTDSVIGSLSQRESPVIFLLWGKPAQSKASLISDRHTVLRAPHPSPLSAYRGFFGSRPFSKTNAALAKNGQGPIEWLSVCER